MSEVKIKSDEELKQLAKDMYDRKVITSVELDGEEVGQVFMLLPLMGPDALKCLDDAAFIYEYLDKAGPISVNGKPCFMSFGIVHKDDRVRFAGYLEAYMKMQEEYASTKI